MPRTRPPYPEESLKRSVRGAVGFAKRFETRPGAGELERQLFQLLEMKGGESFESFGGVCGQGRRTTRWSSWPRVRITSPAASARSIGPTVEWWRSSR